MPRFFLSFSILIIAFCFADGLNAMDIKSCKALSFSSDSDSKLGYSPAIWCGNIKGRFEVVNSGNKFIYDKELKGHWSKKGEIYKNHTNAKKHCDNLGSGWQLPNVYQLVSLLTKKKDILRGYINPIFNDNEERTYWSLSKARRAYFWAIKYNAAMIIEDVLYSNHWVRCFLPDPPAESKPTDKPKKEG
tara:strand:+ start:112 stop:678 length:567 start_codon:yes stop_codon:yes gene_type:complete